MTSKMTKRTLNELLASVEDVATSNPELGTAISTIFAALAANDDSESVPAKKAAGGKTTKTRKRPSRAKQPVDDLEDDDDDLDDLEDDDDLDDDDLDDDDFEDGDEIEDVKTPSKKAKKTPAKKTPAKKTPAKKTPAKKTKATAFLSSRISAAGIAKGYRRLMKTKPDLGDLGEMGSREVNIALKDYNVDMEFEGTRTEATQAKREFLYAVNVLATEIEQRDMVEGLQRLWGTLMDGDAESTHEMVAIALENSMG